MVTRTMHQLPTMLCWPSEANITSSLHHHIYGFMERIMGFFLRGSDDDDCWSHAPATYWPSETNITSSLHHHMHAAALWIHGTYNTFFWEVAMMMIAWAICQLPIILYSTGRMKRTLHHHYIITCSRGMPIRGSFPQFITNWAHSLTIIHKNASKPHKTIIWQFLGLWNLKVHVMCYNQKERREGVEGESEEERERKSNKLIIIVIKSGNHR